MKNDPTGMLAVAFIILLACAFAPSGSPTTAYLKAAKLPQAIRPAHGLPACLLEHVAHIPC